jgi:hypothetical protein
VSAAGAPLVGRPTGVDVTLLSLAVVGIGASAPLIVAIAAPALAIALWRNVLGTAALLPWVLTRARGELAALWRDAHLRRVVLLAGLALAAHFATWVPAVTLTTVTAATALGAVQPVWNALIARAGGQQVTTRVWLGIVLAVLGALVLTGLDLWCSLRSSADGPLPRRLPASLQPEDAGEGVKGLVCPRTRCSSTSRTRSPRWPSPSARKNIVAALNEGGWRRQGPRRAGQRLDDALDLPGRHRGGRGCRRQPRLHHAAEGADRRARCRAGPAADPDREDHGLRGRPHRHRGADRERPRPDERRRHRRRRPRAWRRSSSARRLHGLDQHEVAGGGRAAQGYDVGDAYHYILARS